MRRIGHAVVSRINSPMTFEKYSIGVVIGIALMGMVPSGVSMLVKSDHPHLVLPPLEQGEVVGWGGVLKVQNQGGRRLLIHQLDIQCGCGEKVLQSWMLPPGTNAEIPLETPRVSLNASEFTLAYLTTNDPECSQLEVMSTPVRDSESPRIVRRALRIRFPGSDLSGE